MSDQFSSGIARSPQCSDHCCLFGDGITGSNAKNKCHDHNNNIKKHYHHSLVTTHIISGKFDCLILITRNKTFQCNDFSHVFHEIFGNIFFFFFCFWCFVISPGIIVLKLVLIEGIKLFLCHNSNTEFYRIKHGIVIILKQRTVIRQCHQTGNGPVFFAIA